MVVSGWVAYHGNALLLGNLKESLQIQFLDESWFPTAEEDHINEVPHCA
jgi:hypothetical protein